MRPHTLPPEARPKRLGFPLLVATLPGRDARTLRKEMGTASDAGADLVEIRLDRLPSEEIRRLEHIHDIPIMHAWVPAIATLRSKAEGGEGPDDPHQRAKLFSEALEALPFSFVDLELGRDDGLYRQFREADGRPIGVVRSAHLPASTTVLEMVARLRDGLASGDVSKVVFPAGAGRTVREILPALAPFRGRPFVVHTTGPAGGLLRVLAPRLGMAWVYCRMPEEPVPPRGAAPTLEMEDPTVGSGAGSGSPAEAEDLAARPPSSLAGPPAGVEPSQVPLDRMRRFVDAGPETPWFAVVGKPLGHSLSPAIQSAFLRVCRIGGVYIPVEIASEQELMEVLPALTGFGLGGVNVTQPYKVEALKLAARTSESAQRCGAANTLVRQASPPGSFVAHNTDEEALFRWWKELGLGGSSRVLVVGTGGAARAAVSASLRVGAQVHLVGRSAERASALAAGFPPRSVVLVAPQELHPFPFVVHATTVGRSEGEVLEIPLARALAPGSLLVDLVYRPVAPVLPQLAAAQGARYVDGMRMLLYQAAASFQLLTGRTVPKGTVEAWLAHLPSPGAAAA